MAETLTATITPSDAVGTGAVSRRHHHLGQRGAGGQRHRIDHPATALGNALADRGVHPDRRDALHRFDLVRGALHSEARGHHHHDWV